MPAPVVVIAARSPGPSWFTAAIAALRAAIPGCPMGIVRSNTITTMRPSSGT
jgi:hypothetical protein